MALNRKLLIDCDPGHDDAIMLVIACFQRKYKILGATSCSGNQTIEKTTKNLSNILNFCNRSDIKIAQGSATPIVREPRICAEIHGESGLDGYTFPKYELKLESDNACDFIIKNLKENKNVTIITSGPMTNLGLAIKKDPTICKSIKEIVLMGGSLGEGNITKEAEFNILVDPEAADICFKSGVKLKMLGLNVTRQILVTPEVISKAEKIKTRGSDMFVKLMKVFNENQHNFFGLDAAPLHDPATIISLLNSRAFFFEEMSVTIDTSNSPTEGKTICSEVEPFNCKVAVDVNLKEYWKEVFKALKKCR